MRKLPLILFLSVLFVNFIFCDNEDIYLKINDEISSQIKKRNIIADTLNKYEKITESKIVNFKLVNFDYNPYAFAVEVDSFPGAYIIFDKETFSLLQWPINFLNQDNNIFDKLPVINIFSVLFQKINTSRVDYPIEKLGYINEYASLTEGIDISLIKAEFKENLYMLPGLELYLLKDQRESQKGIDYLNRLNNTSRFKYLNEPDNPSHKCYFFAFANTVDWKRNIAGENLKKDSYINFLNRKKEYGIDPRFLEIVYRDFAGKNNPNFKILPAFFYEDPVTKESVTYGIEGVVEILSKFDEIPDEIEDWEVTKEIFKKRKYYNVLNKFESLKINDENFLFTSEQIKKALKNYGALFAGLGLRHFGAELTASSHAVMICGYYEVDDYFFLVYQDSYGEDKPYKMLPLNYFNFVYAIPSPLDFKVTEKNTAVNILFKTPFGKTIHPEFENQNIDYKKERNGSYTFLRKQVAYSVKFRKDYFMSEKNSDFFEVSVEELKN
ncbi:MAG: hypothetical protein WC337_00075 [Candidatus Muiribacteriota bacterium]